LVPAWTAGSLRPKRLPSTVWRARIDDCVRDERFLQSPIMNRLKRTAVVPLSAGLVLLAVVIIPSPVPDRLVYPNSPVYLFALLAIPAGLWFRDRAGLRLFLASILAFELLHLLFFTALPSFVLRAPPLYCGFMSSGFTALDLHRAGPSDFFGMVAILWAAVFARNRSLAVRLVSAGVLIWLERAPVTLSFFFIHGALGAGLAGLAALAATQFECVHGALPRLPLLVAWTVANVATLALLMAMQPFEPPASGLLVATVLAAVWLVFIFQIPDARPRPRVLVKGLA